MASHKETEDRAAEWLAKRDSGKWSELDQAQLRRWIEQSIAHRVAFLRLEEAWDETRRLRALAAGRQSGTVPPPGEWRNTPFFDSRPQARGEDAVDTWHLIPEDPLEETCASGATAIPAAEHTQAGVRVSARTRPRLSLALAASLVLGIGIYVALTISPERYSTALGRVTSVALRDGSSITLNTATAVRVDLTPTERLIDLQQGEAFFKVAKDPKRPFIVRVGDKRVIAVGTQFSVRRDGNDIRVVVTEGTVRLESAEDARSGTVLIPGPAAPGSEKGSGVRLSGRTSGLANRESMSLTAGTIARATEEDVLVEKETVSQAEEILSWRDGFLRFHDTSLAEAIAEFNRYNSRTITLGDPEVAAIRISGTFRPTNYEAFVRLLREGFAIRAEENGDRIVLTKRSPR